ncbi:hypothetical protein F511_25277 [Dorcoceras hygrometricum]|uniref:Acyl-CoA dehydrogenase-related protein n=1 Tax=Dorcoceras hygrometricum TaxID=472368 RepID=A0A2Z7B1X9_9LAMI|nr:hypothetical protein F511_25277 [Dorcoceras hygrometricum]
MSLFDLQDVCIAIGSIATLDLPMVVDLIGIYGLKGPYCMLTTTNWFLQALSVIPRGSWGDVARRFTMIHWADSRTDTQLNVLSTRREFREVRLPKSQQGSNRGFPLLRGKTNPNPNLYSRPSSLERRRRRAPPVAASPEIVLALFFEENPFVQNSSALLVQADEGVSVLVVDRIGDIYGNLPRRADVIVTTVGARHKCQQDLSSQAVPAVFVETNGEAELSRLRLPCPGEIC